MIGISTSDFLLYHELIDKMKVRDIPFVTLPRNEDIPANVGVIIRGYNDTPAKDRREIVAESVGYRPFINDLDAVINSLIDLAMIELIGQTGKHIFIGVDPGRRPGIAVRTGNTVLETITTSSISNALSVMEDFLDIFSNENVTFRVGNGAPRERDMLVNSLLDMGAQVEVVDESLTSVGRGRNHALAASAISMKAGRKVRSKMHHKISMGYISYIQEQSRIESGGQFTISRSLARMVAEGNLSLAEAVEKYKNTQ